MVIKGRVSLWEDKANMVERWTCCQWIVALSFPSHSNKGHDKPYSAPLFSNLMVGFWTLQAKKV